MNKVKPLNIFTSAQWKLTFGYTLLFFSIFWIFSSLIYLWMARELGDSYISQVRQYRNPQMLGWPEEFQESHSRVVTVAGEVALSKLRRVLIVLDLALAIMIPIGSWILASLTLKPLAFAHEKQKQFVSDASHELRTPLSIISGEIEVTLKKKRTDLIYQRVLKSAKEEVDRLAILVKQLLFLAKSESQTIIKENVDVTDIICGIVGSLSTKFKAKKQKVLVSPDSSPSQIKANESLITQLFYNLIDNAITYSGNSQDVEIVIKNRRSEIRVSISDKGPGIDREIQKQIFERFYRADQSRSSQKGYGLGLAITKRIVELHKGNIDVVSERGSGTTFIVTLPVN